MTAAEDKSPDRLDAAIAWQARLASFDVGEGDLAGFEVWLEADPDNRIAFEQVSELDLALQSALDEAGPADDPALARQSGNLLPFRLQRVAPSRRGWVAVGAGLAAACAIAAVLVFQPVPGRAPLVYATEIGQQKTVKLDDGTVIELNTATRIAVARDGDARHVDLVHGEAVFNVAKDSSHPFLVAAGDRVVRVVGTVFDVRHDDGRVAVVVVQGKVAVGPKNHASAETHLVPGDRLVYIAATGTTALDRVDPARALAWQSGYLVYDNASLSQVIADLNRYFRKPVSLADIALSREKFSGVLKVDDEPAVLRRLQEFLPLTVEETGDGHFLLHHTKKRD